MATIVRIAEENFVQKTIRCLKRIESFRSFHAGDRFALFKRFYHEYKIIFSAFYYNPEFDGFFMVILLSIEHC